MVQVSALVPAGCPFTTILSLPDYSFLAGPQVHSWSHNKLLLLSSLHYLESMILAFPELLHIPPPFFSLEDTQHSCSGKASVDPLILFVPLQNLDC